MLCPEHNTLMRCERTQRGPRYACNEPGCTVVCWNGSTSTPADAQTRALRHQCHELFDRLWKSGRMKRPAAYRWLQKVMGLSQYGAHIGRFDKAQCEKLLAILQGQGRQVN